MFKKKLIVFACVAALGAGMLTGCGKKDSANGEAAFEETEQINPDSLEKVEPEEAAELFEGDGEAVTEEELAALETAGSTAAAREEAAAAEAAEQAAAEAAETATDQAAADTEGQTSDQATADAGEQAGQEDAALPQAATLDTSTELTGKHHASIVIRDYGQIDIELDADSAPLSVTNFVKLAQEGFYNGLTFHRIISGFMIQGGDPNGDGTGGSDATVTGEFTNNGIDNPLSHTRGAVSMARTTDPDSASSQFFIVHEDATYLDGDYAVFGYVTNGMDVVDAICAAATPTDDNGSIAPEAQPIIENITITD